MKMPQYKSNQGTALLVTMIFVLTLASALVSYLMIIENADTLVSRSQYWNASLALAESGVEEALAQLNSGTTQTANGWTVSGGNWTLTRSLNGGSYSVVIQPGTTATIYSTGLVTVPIRGSIVSRVVKVTAYQQGMFNTGLGAVDNINMNGNSVSADSWNSADPTESTGGLYNGYSGNQGSVASENGVVSIGNHTIQGNLYLGPNASYSSANNQVTGTIYTDYNVQFPDEALPTTDPATGAAVSWQAAPVVNLGGNGKKFQILEHDFTSSGDYIISDSYPIIVEPGVTVTLDVQTLNFSPSSVTINDNGSVASSGTIYMYQESGSVTLGGNSTGGAIGDRPENFYFFGLPGVTSITLGGTSTFVGAIYAPEATLTLNGGGNGNNLEGAAIVNSVTLNGHYDFHYDVSLGTNGPTRGFIANSWQEM